MLLGRRLVLWKGCDQVHLLVLHGRELLLLLIFVVLLLLLRVMNLFFHGFHEGVHDDALLDRLFRWFWG